MRNIASSPYLENPDLVEIKSAMVANKRVAEFTMNLSLKRQQADDAAGAGAAKGGAATKGGAAAAAKKG